MCNYNLGYILLAALPRNSSIIKNKLRSERAIYNLEEIIQRPVFPSITGKASAPMVDSGVQAELHRLSLAMGSGHTLTRYLHLFYLTWFHLLINLSHAFRRGVRFYLDRHVDLEHEGLSWDIIRTQQYFLSTDLEFLRLICNVHVFSYRNKT